MTDARETAKSNCRQAFSRLKEHVHEPGLPVAREIEAASIDYIDALHDLLEGVREAQADVAEARNQLRRQKP